MSLTFPRLVTKDSPGQPPTPHSPGAFTGDPARPAGASGIYAWPDPAKPTAMLAPRYVRENRALRRTRRLVIAGFVAVSLLAVIGTLLSFTSAHSSQRALADAQNQQAAAQTQVDSLASIASYYDGLEQRRKTTVALLETDVRHAAMFDALRHALPAGASLTTYATALGVPCPGPNPFEQQTGNIGCLSVSGMAKSTGDVASLLAHLRQGTAAKVFSEAFVTNMSDQGDTGVTFALDINFTDAAFSMKYVPAAEAEATRALAAQAVLSRAAATSTSTVPTATTTTTGVTP